VSHDLREDLIRYRLEQADGAIQAAEALFPLALYRETISRSYYAMFYAVLALLCRRDRETSKHSGAIAFFDL